MGFGYAKSEGGKMKTEDLKQLAIHLGCEAEIRDKGFTSECVMISGDTNVGVRWIKYNPLENAEQDREIEIKFEIDTSFISKDLHQAVVGLNFGMTGGIEGRGKTPSEARLNAAIAAIKK